jgi:hypothetical protein
MQCLGFGLCAGLHAGAAFPAGEEETIQQQRSHAPAARAAASASHRQVQQKRVDDKNEVKYSNPSKAEVGYWRRRGHQQEAAEELAAEHAQLKRAKPSAAAKASAAHMAQVTALGHAKKSAEHRSRISKGVKKFYWRMSSASRQRRAKRCAATMQRVWRERTPMQLASIRKKLSFNKIQYWRSTLGLQRKKLAMKLLRQGWQRWWNKLTEQERLDFIIKSQRAAFKKKTITHDNVSYWYQGYEIILF